MENVSDDITSEKRNSEFSVCKRALWERGRVKRKVK
jgi:hypothetical protein